MTPKNGQVVTADSQISIAIESPQQDEVIKLVMELDIYLHSLYPPESVQVLSIDELAKKDVRFFVARRNGEAFGCGGLRIDTKERYGEVKRMFVLPAARGLAIGRKLLGRIMVEAIREELSCLRLETGIHQLEALSLYRSFGFVERGPFGEHWDDPTSIFMEKAL